MSVAFRAFEKSNAWDARYNLPLSPQNNNPWFYLACAVKVINLWDKHDIMEDYSELYYEQDPFRERVNGHLTKCEKEPGLFNRWPDGSGGVTSHDELMGIAYLSSTAAKRILAYLASTDGDYNNTDIKPEIPEMWNLNRFFWFTQFLKACAGIKLSLLSQLIFCIQIVYDGLTAKPDDAGGRLRMWLMYERMVKFPLTGLALKWWKGRMINMGLTPAMMLKIEPKENPVYAEFGPTEWT